MISQSHIVNLLTPVDELTLQTEFQTSGVELNSHYLQIELHKAPLRHGKSKYIYALNLKDSSVILDNRCYFPNTLKILSMYSKRNSESLARCYWHELKPGERIDLHRDYDNTNNGFNYFNRIDRFHFFPFVVHEQFVVVMDSRLWNVEPTQQLSHSVIHFNAGGWHFYLNNTDSPVAFLVADYFIS